MGLFDQPRTLTATSPALPDHLGQPALVPVRLQGEEGLSSLFTYHLELKTPEALAFSPSHAANFNLDAMVGKEITLALQLEGKGHFTAGALGQDGEANQGAGVREISALITEAGYLREEGRHQVYGLTLRPWLWLATLTQDCKIFQDKAVIDILDEILADYPFAVEKRLESGKYPIRDYQTQFNETDFDFLARLCEEWGIAWWFEHSEGKHRLILADQPGAYRSSPSAAYKEVSYYPPGYKIDEEYLHAFSVRSRLVTGAWGSTDVDYTRTRADLAVGRGDPRPTGHADQAVFHWPVDSSQPKAGAGGMSGQANDPLEEGGHLARVRQEALRAEGQRATAQGHVRGLAAGHTFRLKGYPQDAANIEWLILSTRLDIEEIAEESQGSAGIPAQQWRCTVDLTAQPSREIYRPPAITRKPIIQGGVRATVTTPSGKEMWTDPYGRVKVAFPWDRYHQNDERSSCWLRVVSPWAGNQYGGIQIPRVGQEVWVGFEGGDPDRPLVTGRVVNNQNLPPWELPANQALSGFRSKELYGQRHNHLILDDSEGEIQAQLSSDHALSQLNLGSITRVPDNSGRADKRGEGFELRTDAHGVVRAGSGLLVTTEKRGNAASYVKSMGETLSRLEIAQEDHALLANLARQHQAQASGEQETVAKGIKAQNQGLQGHGKPDAENGSFPEFAEPHLTLASPAGIQATTAGSTHIASGQDTALTTGANLSIASNGSLFASIKAGIRIFAYKLGLRLVAANGDIDIQALKDNINLLAKLSITETAETIEIVATKNLKLIGGDSVFRLTHGAASIETSSLRFHCDDMDVPPGKSTTPPKLPEPVATKEAMSFILRSHPGEGHVFINEPYELYRDGAVIATGVTDAWGRIVIPHQPGTSQYAVKLANGASFDLPVSDAFTGAPGESGHHEQHLSNQGYRSPEGAQSRLLGAGRHATDEE